MATAPCRDALEVIRVARSTVESQPIETAMGASTVLPGVPLPAWTLPAEVLPEPEPTPEAAPVEEHAESSLEAAVLVASMATANHAEPGDVPPLAPTASVVSRAEVAAPVEDAVQIAAPPLRSLPAPEPAPAPPTTSEPAGVVTIGLPAASATTVPESPATTTDSGPAPSGPWDQPGPDAPFAPHDTLAQIPAPQVDAAAEVEPREGWDEAAAALGATAVASVTASVEPTTDEAVPHRHGHDGVAPTTEPARRRFGLRRKAASASDEQALPADEPTPGAPVGLPAPTAAAVDLPAPVDAPLDLPAPADAPLDLPAPSDAPIGLNAPADAPLDADDHETASRRPLVLLAAVGGVLVAAAVAAFVWPGLLVSHDDATTPAPLASVPTASAPVAPVTLQTPDTAAGYVKLTGAPATALAQAATGTTLDGFTAPVTAVYGANGVPKATVIAWAATSPATASTITSAFAGFVNASGVAVTAISPVATGTLGGSMRCGVTTVQGAPATACFWADDASFGAVTVLSPATPVDGATTATAIRLTVETRG